MNAPAGAVHLSPSGRFAPHMSRAQGWLPGLLPASPRFAMDRAQGCLPGSPRHSVSRWIGLKAANHPLPSPTARLLHRGAPPSISCRSERGYSTMVVQQPSKLRMRVRFPLSAPTHHFTAMRSKPAVMKSTICRYPPSRSVEHTFPPDRWSRRPVCAKASVKAPDRQWYPQ